MAARDLPDVAYLRECLDYDPSTGEFWWRERPRGHFSSEQGWKMRNTRFAGKQAGTVMPVGYLHLSLNYRFYYAHRLVWLLTYGAPVPLQIDHIDGDRANNRVSNLRAANHADNGANAKVHRDNSIGVKGVRLRKRDGTFQAYIARDGKMHILGNFATIEEAAAVRREAAERLHGKFARHA